MNSSKKLKNKGKKEKPSKNNTSTENSEDTSGIWKDERFAHLVKDPRFKTISKKERKVKIDKRFQSMFEDPKFKVKYTYDKYGRKINKSSTEDLKKYYDLPEEDDSDKEEEEKPVSDEEQESEEDKSDDENDALEGEGDISKKIKKRLKDLDIDYARGEGKLLTDSSSDDESSSDEEEGPGLNIDHVWGELDRDAPLTEDSSRRLAVCNMDWDKIRAEDIMVLCNSFLPPNGTILSVAVYPSEFGKERMAEEELKGPPELVNKEKKSKKDDDSDIDDLLGDSGDEDSEDDQKKLKRKRQLNEEEQEGDEYHMEKLRQYQLNRLKYYYAVIECDSISTADKLYAECDGLEYESSAAKFDLRFIPDDMEFEDEPREKCTELPDLTKYEPRQFQTTALQNAKVELTWDETNEDRKEFTEKMMEGKMSEISEIEMRKYLAYSSDEEEEPQKTTTKLPKVANSDSSEDEEQEDQSTIAKYRNLLNEINDQEQKKMSKDIEMEFSWNVGAQEKQSNAQSEEKTPSSKALTPFEKLIEKREHKKKLKKEKLMKKQQKNEDNLDESEDDVPDGIDMNDPYFAEEFANGEFAPNKSKTKKKSTKEEHEEAEKEDRKQQAELALLLEDEEDTKKSHFSLKKIQSAESETNSKRKRKKLLKKSKEEIAASKQTVQDDFEINLEDDRFKAVYSSHLYNIDPTDPHFKKTKGMEKIISEKLKRKRGDDDPDDSGDFVPKKDKKSIEKITTNMLVNNIKRKINKKL